MQNFGRENFDDSTCICQIRQTFPPSKFYAIRYCQAGKINNTLGMFFRNNLVDEFNPPKLLSYIQGLSY